MLGLSLHLAKILRFEGDTVRSKLVFLPDLAGDHSVTTENLEFVRNISPSNLNIFLGAKTDPVCIMVYF
jgi:hypothetical protein